MAFKGYLECCICMDTSKKSGNKEVSVFSCSSDHLICDECVRHVEGLSCPVCREDFGGKTPSRNFLAEKVIDAFNILRTDLSKKPKPKPQDLQKIVEEQGAANFPELQPEPSEEPRAADGVPLLGAQDDLQQLPESHLQPVATDENIGLMDEPEVEELSEADNQDPQDVSLHQEEPSEVLQEVDGGEPEALPEVDLESSFDAEPKETVPDLDEVKPEPETFSELEDPSPGMDLIDPDKFTEETAA